MVPPARWALTVIIALAADNASSGSFSATSHEKLLGGTVAATLLCASAGGNIRCSGQ